MDNNVILGDTDSPPIDDYLWGHPKGMYVLFLTEMWERFSFYGMRALLIFYLTQHLLFQDSQAFIVYGSFVSLVYVMPILGGYLGNHYLGYTKAVILGGILMIFGHLGMTFEGAAATVIVGSDGSQSIVRDDVALQVFYLSLALLVVGVGFLKPNIAILLANLYPKTGHRREVGFLVFSMGISIGGALAAFVCGYLGVVYGWAYGFGSAGIGMCVGLAVFLYGQRHLHGVGAQPERHKYRKIGALSFRREWEISLYALLSVAVIWQLIQFGRLGGYLIISQFILAVSGILLYAIFKLNLVERRNIFFVLFIMAMSAIFAAFIEQYGITINLFTLRHVNLDVYGTEIVAPQLQGLLALFIICLAPVVILIINFLANRQKYPSSLIKMGVGFILLGLGFLLVNYGTTQADHMSKISIYFMVGMYLLWALADNVFLPLSMSVVTKLATPNMTGVIMGTYALAFSVGYFGASILAQLGTVNSADFADRASVDSLDRYSDFFRILGSMAVTLGFVLITLNWVAKRLRFRVE